ncbi:hypothetical protein GW17_00059224, partial [Ensete ventricosum]
PKLGPERRSSIAFSSPILRANQCIRSFSDLFSLQRFPSFRRSRSALSPRIRRLAEEEKETLKTLRVLTSLKGAFFPYGLPSLRFFIDEGALTRFYSNNVSSINDVSSASFACAVLPRKSTKGGSKVIAHRLAKGRARIAVYNVAVASQMDAGDTGSCHGDPKSP